MLSSKEIRKKFLDYWKSAPRNHKEIPNISLVPNVDSTLLFVNSGMFPLAPYLSGEEHPLGSRVCNIQRCLRTKYDEMIEIGDNRHTLMFEMRGNWSFGDYFKEEQIEWKMKFYVDELGLDPHRLYVSVWAGDDLIGRDDVAIKAWKKVFKEYGIEAEFSEDITQIPSSLEKSKNHKFRIFPYGKSDNWWQRGEAAGELGGPSSEIFYDIGKVEREQEEYHINDDSGRFSEIGNSVFMEYYLDDSLNWQKLSQKNIDFGGGFERTVMCVQGKSDIFETDLYFPILEKIEEISGKSYKSGGVENEYTSIFRVIADHTRIAVFVIGDGVVPSNKDQGYILRKFIRRLVRFGDKLGLDNGFTKEVADVVINTMKSDYKHLLVKRSDIFKYLEKEEVTFRKTLSRGLKELSKIKSKNEKIDGKKAFYIYETYGFPLDLTLGELEVSEAQIGKIEEEFREAEKKHRAKSRAGAEQKFAGGLADKSEDTVKLHTTQHLMLAALQQVLGSHVHQKGSNITSDRIRMDFSHTGKLTDNQIEEVENLVQEKIDHGWVVVKKTLPKQVAEELGAEMEFGAKYSDLVNIYLIVDPEVKKDTWPIPDNQIFSKEFCGGPHVETVKGLGKFKIVKQESVGAGVRRIKAVLS